MKLKLAFWKTCICNPVLDSFPICKDIFAKTNGTVNVIFLICSKEMCQHLDYLHNSVNQDFPKSHIGKDSFKVQGGLLDLMVTKYREFV